MYFLICKVCGESYDDKDRIPLLYNCGHSICQPCCVRSKNNNQNKIKCPLCRNEKESALIKNYDILQLFNIIEQRFAAFESGKIVRCSGIIANIKYLITDATKYLSEHLKKVIEVNESENGKIRKFAIESLVANSFHSYDLINIIMSRLPELNVLVSSEIIFSIRSSRDKFIEKRDCPNYPEFYYERYWSEVLNYYRRNEVDCSSESTEDETMKEAIDHNLFEKNICACVVLNSKNKNVDFEGVVFPIGFVLWICDPIFRKASKFKPGEDVKVIRVPKDFIGWWGDEEIKCDENGSYISFNTTTDSGNLKLERQPTQDLFHEIKFRVVGLNEDGNRITIKSYANERDTYEFDSDDLTIWY